jgi:hypothetical protein
MRATIAGVAIIVAQAAQPLGAGSKGQEWCSDGGKEPSSAKPRRPSATDCGGSIPRSRKARADMWSRRRSSNRQLNRLRPAAISAAAKSDLKNA